MRWLAGVLMAAVPFAAWAEDARLGELRGMLVPIRKIPAEHLRVRGATVELTVIKHKLRDWVQSRLAVLAPDGDPAALVRQLNEELKQAGFSALLIRRAAKRRVWSGRYSAFLVRSSSTGHRVANSWWCRLPWGSNAGSRNPPTRTNGTATGGGGSGRVSKTTTGRRSTFHKGFTPS